MQPPEYHPQPYRQLAKVLGEMGRDDGAIQVRIAKEIAQRRFGHETTPQRAWSLILQYTIGFGYLPLRALWWIAGFVGLGTLLFGWGYRMRIITPTEEPAYREFVASGEAPPHYPVFNPLVYSLENFLPVVDSTRTNTGAPTRATRCPPNPGAGASRATRIDAQAASCDGTCGSTSSRAGPSRRYCSPASPAWSAPTEFRSDGSLQPKSSSPSHV